MIKEEFIRELDLSLKNELIQNRETYLSYYSEIIEDYLEDGYTEEEAVNKLDEIPSIVKTIQQEIGNTENKTSNKNPIIILLLIIGAPLWGSILLSVLLLLFSSLIILWCAPFSLGMLSFAGLLTGAVSLMGLTFNTGIYYIVTQLGVGIFALGLGLFLLLGTVYITKYVGSLSKKIIDVLSNVFSWKGRIF